MSIVFDDGVARRLRAVVKSTADELHSQHSARWNACELARPDFEGVFAEVFLAEVNRGRSDIALLVKALDSFSGQLGRVIEEAQEEVRRLHQRAAWEEREQTRVSARAAGDPFQWMAGLESSVSDPEPRDEPIRPTPIVADFQAGYRLRVAGRHNASLRSSADPERLRASVASTNWIDRATEDVYFTLRDAWIKFTVLCAWARIDSATFLNGFAALLEENLAHTNWVLGVADAFDRAGGGSLTNQVLDSIATQSLSDLLATVLRPGLTPAEVAAAWAAAGLTAADVGALPLDQQYVLANLDGLPASIRDVASRAVLNYPLKKARDSSTTLNPGRQRELYVLMMGHQPELSFEDFNTQMAALRAAVKKADAFAKDLEDTASDPVAQLVGIGVHDGAPVAAITLGNLDTASNVVVNVPGADTNVANLSDKIAAADRLLGTAAEASPGTSFSIVSWLGFRTPSGAEIAAPDRARAGGERLAAFLDGVTDGRSTAPTRVTLAGHSYGSTTVAAALTQTRHPVDSFISYGSAGFNSNIAVADLHTDKVFATEAGADWIAGVGRAISWRQDPREFDGVTTFSSEADAKRGTVAGTGHDMNPEEGVGYLSPNSTSLARIVDIVTKGRP